MKEDGDTLTFRINLSVIDVNTYYKKEFPKVGWNLLSEGISNSNNILNIYINGEQIITIAIVRLEGASDTVVIIVAS